jgi:hypothetical protein
MFVIATEINRSINSEELVLKREEDFANIVSPY